jgi:hypothetical protein
LARTRADLSISVLSRLGDSQEAIWSTEEIDGYLQDGLSDLCRAARPIIDAVYLENRFEHFVCTYQDELAMLEALSGAATGAISRITFEDERDLLTLSEQATWPRARYITSPFESEFFADIAEAMLPAVSDVDDGVIDIDRALWDARAIYAFTTRDARSMDSRFETHAGEVYGLIWQYDGPRTVRKFMRPSAEADVLDIDGAFGILRDAGTVATSTTSASGTYGIARRIPGHQPLGAFSFGTPRRVYLDGKNVRAEVARQAAPLDVFDDVIELPDRYADYLKDYAMAEALGRPGVGQQPQLAQHYQSRWATRIERVKARMRRVSTQRVSQLGGSAFRRTRPPAPRLPWAYPAVGV